MTLHVVPFKESLSQNLRFASVCSLLDDFNARNKCLIHQGLSVLEFDVEFEKKYR